MTSPRDRLEAQMRAVLEVDPARREIRISIADLKALLSERRVGREALAGMIVADPAYLAEVRDEQQEWLALHLADNIVSLLADQPLPSVATGHPEQGALLSGWQDISTAQRVRDTAIMLNRSMICGVAAKDVREGRMTKDASRAWVDDASKVFEQGLDDIAPLPAPPSLPADGTGRAPSPPQTAEAVPGTNPKPPRQGGE